MSDKKKVLITGGAGFIGSHVNLLLRERGYDTTILDNLSRGNPNSIVGGELIRGEIGDRELLDRLFSQESFDAVMHFAAFTDVGESTAQPELYYENNVVESLTLIEAVQRHRIPAFIFSSSAAVYGNPDKDVVQESDLLSPINPYGRSKLMVEQILDDFSTYHGMKSTSLRYFNAAGGDPEGRIRHRKPKENNLIPIVLLAALESKPVTIFGTDYPTPDGTCLRDYIHVLDLAEAHLLAMERLLHGGDSTHYNLGNGNGYSVRQVIQATEEVTGQKIQVLEGDRRAGDPAILLSNAKKASQELNWKPQYPALSDIVAHAWNAYRPAPKN